MAYIFPAGTPAPQVLSLIQRAGASLVVPEKLHMVIGSEEMDDGIVGLTTEQVIILTRNAGELLVKVPTVIRTMPGIVYPAAWLMAAAMFPVVDWHSFEGTLAKSGLLAMNVTAAQSRPKSAIAVGHINDPDEDLPDASIPQGTGDGEVDSDGIGAS